MESVRHVFIDSLSIFDRTELNPFCMKENPLIYNIILITAHKKYRLQNNLLFLGSISAGI